MSKGYFVHAGDTGKGAGPSMYDVFTWVFVASKSAFLRMPDCSGPICFVPPEAVSWSTCVVSNVVDSPVVVGR